MGARLELERTARQIAQYHPQRRFYQYMIEMPQADLIRFVTARLPHLPRAAARFQPIVPPAMPRF